MNELTAENERLLRELQHREKASRQQNDRIASLESSIKEIDHERAEQEQLARQLTEELKKVKDEVEREFRRAERYVASNFCKRNLCDIKRW